MNRNFWELCSLLFSGVLKDTPNRILSDLTYVRYILVYKMWKRVVQGPEERKKVMSLASLRLKHPPQFVEKIRAGFLNGIIPKIPKKRADVTTFLIQAKFDVKEKAKAFLKYVVESRNNVMFAPAVPAIKTDIPLLVGHLPDFGPSPDLVKLEPPEIEDEDPQNVDISGIRLMNEVWTSVNHEASFREAIRMQSVTTFSRTEAKLAGRKKMHRVLKQRKGRVKNTVNSKSSPAAKEKRPQAGFEKTYDPIVTCPTIVVSDDSEKGSDKMEGAVRKKEKYRNKSRKRSQEEKSDQRAKTISKKLVPENSAPPIMNESPQSPDRVAVQDMRILTPSQIKQEIHDDVLVEDDVILDLPLPQKCGDDSIVGKEDAAGTLSATCPKAEIEIDDSIGSSHVPEKTIEVLNETLCDLKEERQSPTKESEVGIISSGILDPVRSPEEDKDPVDQVGIKLSESPSLENERPNVDVDPLRAAKPLASPEKRRKEDAILFDDEESSWSPSGGSQEFIRRVVTNFISEYSPDDEVENRLVESSIPSASVERTNQVVDDDFDLVELAYGEKSNFDVSDPNPPEDVPPAKRYRIEKAASDEGSARKTIINRSSSVVVDSVASHSRESNEPSKVEVQPEQAANLGKHSLHAETLRFHHSCYMEQAKFRDLCTSFHVTPEDEVPSAYFKDPTTGQLTQGCCCEQCTANFTALCSNVKCLVEFKAQTLLSMENESVPSASVEALDQFEGKQDETMDHGEGMGDFGGAGGEASVQLPFKKRKAFSGRDDGESQHSDASKEDVEPRQWEDYPSHTPTRMFSIAALEDIAMTRPQPLGSCMYESALPACAASTSVVNPGGGFFSTDFHPTQSTGGGFPPFSSVVRPETRAPYYTAPSQNSTIYPSSQDSHLQTHRHFRTPAQRKATFHDEPASVPESPWTQDLVNVAYFTRNLNTTPYPSNSKKQQKSRKTKSSRKKK